MGLIIFECLFMVVLGIMTAFIFTRKDAYGKQLALLSFATLITSALLVAIYILLFFDISGLSIKILSKFMFSGIVVISSLLFNIAIKAPYFDKKIVLTILNAIVGIAGIVFVVLFIDSLSWNSLSGFVITSKPLTEDLNALSIFYFVYFLGIPVLCAFILFFRAFRLKSNIYRQQLFLTATLMFFLGVSLFITAKMSNSLFSWIFSFFPIPYIVMILLTSYAFSLSVVFDRKELLLSFLRFLVFTLFFATIAGVLVGGVLSYVRNFGLQIAYILLIVVVVLLVRQFVQSRFSWLFGDTAEYARPLEKTLQAIDYGKGRDEVIADFTNALKTYVGCSTVDILVSNDKGILEVAYSSLDNMGEYDTGLPAFEYLLEKNVQVLLHTELITSYEYITIRPELNALFSKTGSDLIIFIRDGQKLIGAFALGPKLRKAEYGLYDVELMKNLYSYFFLGTYYLKNIAKQDIIITVDREIEMSDQIISSIQSSVDTIKSDNISVDSVSYSAYKLGGDFIDFIRLSENRYFFLIGDVAGKGLSASMSMIILKSILRTFLEESLDFKELVVKVNLFVKQNLPKGTFFAGLFGVLDLKANTIYYLNCGIPLMSMYMNTYKNAIEVQGEGRVLGFVKNIKPFLKVRKIVMNPNDTIVFTTDGLLESVNLRGDRFGKDRVGRILTENSSKTTLEIANTIYNSLLEFVSRELQDDITILVFKRNE